MTNCTVKTGQSYERYIPVDSIENIEPHGNSKNSPFLLYISTNIIYN